MSRLLDERITIEQGGSARLKATLSVGCVPVIGTVTLTVKDPLGALSSPSVAELSVGVYYTDIEVDISGQWKYRWVSIDPVAAKDGSFIVGRSQLL